MPFKEEKWHYSHTAAGKIAPEPTAFSWPARRGHWFLPDIHSKVFFLEWHWREFGVSADGADGNKFLHFALPGSMHQLHAHHQVVVKKFSRMFAVGANPTHLGCQMDDHIRFGIVQHLVYGILVNQIIFFNQWAQRFPSHRVPSVSGKPLTQKTRSASDAKAAILEEVLICHFYGSSLQEYF